MNEDLISVGLLGATGRMGQWVERLIREEYSSVARLEVKSSLGDALERLLKTEVVIDFSSPKAMANLAQKAIAQAGNHSLPAFVVGSTGWSESEKEQLERLSAHTLVLVSSNFSTGVLALQQILKSAAPLLKKLGYEPVLSEVHHRHKKDAPSGTALTLQKIISPESPSEVQTLSVRAGEIIGDHEIIFYGPGDHISLGHFAQDRSIFARGAVDVALWLARRRKQADQSKGLLKMEAYLQECFNV